MKTYKRLIIGILLIWGMCINQSCTKYHTYLCTCYESIQAGYPPYKTDTIKVTITTTNSDKPEACASYSSSVHVFCE